MFDGKGLILNITKYNQGGGSGPKILEKQSRDYCTPPRLGANRPNVFILNLMGFYKTIAILFNQC